MTAKYSSRGTTLQPGGRPAGTADSLRIPPVFDQPHAHQCVSVCKKTVGFPGDYGAFGRRWGTQYEVCTSRRSPMRDCRGDRNLRLMEVPHSKHKHWCGVRGEKPLNGSQDGDLRFGGLLKTVVRRRSSCHVSGGFAKHGFAPASARAPCRARGIADTYPAYGEHREGKIGARSRFSTRCQSRGPTRGVSCLLGQTIANPFACKKNRRRSTNRIRPTCNQRHQNCESTR